MIGSRMRTAGLKPLGVGMLKLKIKSIRLRLLLTRITGPEKLDFRNSNSRKTGLEAGRAGAPLDDFLFSLPGPP
jgi:hypothetical protein